MGVIFNHWLRSIYHGLRSFESLVDDLADCPRVTPS